MKSLELRIPPVMVTFLFAGLMWLVAQWTPPYSVPPPLQALTALLFLLAGAIVGLAGVANFRKAKTTVNPLQPEKSSSLVVGGVYRFSRNPMYLALLMVLFAWGIYLSNPYAMLTAWMFILYINRFQIIPEERAMEKRFGADFQRYRQQVRRWI